MYACNGILFNHESPRRGETFVTKNYTGSFRIAVGLDECLYMGNLDSLRDWGHARDYVEMQWRMLQQEGQPEFCYRDGSTRRCSQVYNLAAIALEWGEIIWEGEGINEVGKRADTGAIVVRIDPDIFDLQRLRLFLRSDKSNGKIEVDANYFIRRACG